MLMKIILNLDNVSEVQSLIDRGVEINSGIMSRNEKPLTYPVHIAIGLKRHDCTFKQFEITFSSTYKLFKIGIFFVIDDDFGIEILKLLIKNGADLEVVDLTESTPL